MSGARLRPAQYDEASQGGAYRPGFPWARVVAVVVALFAGWGLYTWRQGVRAEAVRQELETIHAGQIAPTLAALQELRDAVEEYAFGARGGAATRQVDEGLRFSELHDKRIVYARVTAPDLRSETNVRQALQRERPDSLGPCLGFDVLPASKLYEVPTVLTDEWLQESKDKTNVAFLRMRKAQLEQAVQIDLKRVSRLAPADYFLLAVVQGQDRTRDPVDVFMWDLRSGEQLVRTRTDAKGQLINFRNRFADGVRGTRKDNPHPDIVADCAIATHLKEITQP